MSNEDPVKIGSEGLDAEALYKIAASRPPKRGNPKSNTRGGDALSPLSSFLRDRRLRAGLTQEAVARAGGLSTVWYSRIERSVASNPSVDALVRIGHALKLDTAEMNELLALATAESVEHQAAGAGAKPARPPRPASSSTLTIDVMNQRGVLYDLADIIASRGFDVKQASTVSSDGTSARLYITVDASETQAIQLAAELRTHQAVRDIHWVGPGGPVPETEDLGHWADQPSQITIFIRAKNRRGLIRDIAAVMASFVIDIREHHTLVGNHDTEALLWYTIDTPKVAVRDQLRAHLQHIEGVVPGGVRYMLAPKTAQDKSIRPPRVSQKNGASNGAAVSQH
jgi:transcriptional regulator with XRE-family HTH domain